MTKRDFMNNVVNGNIDKYIIEFAQKEIERMDLAQEKRKNTLSKKALEDLSLMDKIFNEILGTEPKTATDVSEVIEVSVQKASYLLRNMVKEGKATETSIKIPKKGTHKAYIQNFIEEEKH